MHLFGSISTMSDATTITAGLASPTRSRNGSARQARARAHRGHPRHRLQSSPNTAATSPRPSSIAPSGAASPPSRSSSAPPPFAAILPHIQRGIMRAVALQRCCCDAPPRPRPGDPGAARSSCRGAPPNRTAPPAGSGHSSRPRTSTPAEPPPAQTAAAAPPAAAARRSRSRSTPCPAWRNSKPRSAAARSAAPSSISAAISASPPALCDGSVLEPGVHGDPLLSRQPRQHRAGNAAAGEAVRQGHTGQHPNLALPEQTREGIRRVLGFFIGEPPVDPFRPATAPGAPVAAAATGPP